MILPFPELVARYRMHITGVLHIGGHHGEEAAIYDAVGIDRVCWVEANIEVMDRLRDEAAKYGHRVIHALVAEENNLPIALNITGPYAGSSSILEFGTHPEFSPETKMVGRRLMGSRTIDSLVAQHGILGCNMLMMDIQGAELRALKGATEYLRSVDYVLSEVNDREVYKGCAKVWELDALLSNFQRVETSWVHDQGWGDACWIRKERL